MPTSATSPRDAAGRATIAEAAAPVDRAAAAEGVVAAGVAAGSVEDTAAAAAWAAAATPVAPTLRR